MFYVYFLQSVSNPKKKYVGRTRNIESRLAVHNNGGCPFTSRFTPWVLEAYVAVRTEKKAIELENYFKSGSGRAFTERHLR